MTSTDQARRSFFKQLLAASAMLSWPAQRASAGEKKPAVGVLRQVGAERTRAAMAAARDGFSFVREETSELVILGGGPAGLSALYAAHHGGREADLLEIEDFIGGPLRSERAQPHLSLGTTYFYRYQGALKAMLDDLGLKVKPTAEDSIFFRRDEIVTDWWSQKNIQHLPVSASERESLMMFRDYLIGLKRVPSFPISRAPKDLIDEFDTISAEEIAKRFGGALLAGIIDSFCRSVFGAPAALVSAYAFVNFYSGEFGAEFDLPCYELSDGMPVFVEAMVKKVGMERIRTGCTPVSISRTKEGRWTINYFTASSERARLSCNELVLAIPRAAAAALLTEGSSPLIADNQNPGSADYLTLQFRSEKQLVPHDSFDTWMLRQSKLVTDVVSLQPAGDAGNTLAGFDYLTYVPVWGRGASPVNDDAALRETGIAILDDLTRLFDLPPEAILRATVIGWQRAMPIPGTGCYRRRAQHLSALPKGLKFVHTSADYVGGFEIAAQNGLGI
jgi:protoporphyrinogen oxidase